MKILLSSSALLGQCVLALGALTACTGYWRTAGFVPGVTTRETALAEAGPPTSILRNPDGSEILEYSLQPIGSRTILVTVGPDGKVRSVLEALDSDNLARVQPGMSRDEIRRLLGTPRWIYHFRSGEEVWDWNVRDPGPQLGMLFNVHFREGKVVRTSKSFYDSGDDRRLREGR